MEAGAPVPEAPPIPPGAAILIDAEEDVSTEGGASADFETVSAGEAGEFTCGATA